MNVRGFPSPLFCNEGSETKEEAAPATELDGPPWPHENGRPPTLSVPGLIQAAPAPFTSH